MSIDQVIVLILVCVCLAFAIYAFVQAIRIDEEIRVKSLDLSGRINALAGSIKKDRRLELYEKIISWQVRRWHLAWWDKCTLREWLGLSPEEYQEFLTGNRSDSVPRTDAQ